MKSSLFINPPSCIVGTVPSEAPLKSSGFILFLEKIVAGGKQKPTGFMQQTTVIVCSHIILRKEIKDH